VTGDFGVCRCFTEGRNKELGPAMHGQKITFRPATACADILGSKAHSNRKRVEGRIDDDGAWFRWLVRVLTVLWIEAMRHRRTI
jgi:hypothetical protein